MKRQVFEHLWELSQEVGLDPFPVHFQLIPVHAMYQLGAYGLPGRYSHWTHGRSYHVLKTRYDHGLQRIYELVINSDPCQAYLLDRNSDLENKLIAAHVLGHSDFFKNNIHFADTNRRMDEVAMLHARRLRQYELEHGTREVERLLDCAIALQEHSVPYAGNEVYRPSRKERASDYDDLFQLGTAQSSAFEAHEVDLGEHCPERDLLFFFTAYAPDLKEWERDVLHIVRTEWLYFRPQLMTRIANEGWATFWHRELLRAMNLSQEEFLQFAALHAQVSAPSRLTVNPYHLGLKLWEHVEKLEGRQGMFEARQLESDASLVRNYLDKELVQELDLFTYQLRGTRWLVTDSAADQWTDVRDELAMQLVERGVPTIRVVDHNYRGRNELFLWHNYHGTELDQKYAQKTLEYVYELWKRPVHLETVFGDMLTEITCSGAGELQIESKGRYVS